MFKYKKINQDILLLLFICIYVLLFALFYPRFYTTLDEQSQIRTAYLLIHKGSFLIDNPLYSHGLIFNGQAYIPPYPLGQSLLLLPFVIFGLKVTFLFGLIIHLLGSYVFYKILKKQGEEIYNVLLFLLFPYFIYYSTTLFRDFSSAFFIMAAFYFYIQKSRKDHGISGVFFGIACLIRYTNLLVFLPFAAVSLFKDRTRLRYLLLGFVPFGLIILGYNHMFYGGMFSTQPASYLGESIIQKAIPISTFSTKNYLYYIPRISFRLLIIYPLMLIAPFYYKREGRIEILLTTLAFFLLFAARKQSGFGYGLGPSTLTRYFIPIIPLYLITYIPFYKKLLKMAHLPHKSLMALVIIVLFVGSIFILSGQHKYLDQQYSVSKEIYSNTNEHALIIGHSGIKRYLVEPMGDRRYLNWGIDDMTQFLDNNTYIVYKKRFESDDEIMEKLEKRYENKLQLIYQSEYEGVYKISRPFNVKIYYIN